MDIKEDQQYTIIYNKRIRYLLCAIDLFSKYAWVVLFKDKREITIVNGYQNLISKGRKPNKIWDDQGGELLQQSFQQIFEN